MSSIYEVLNSASERIGDITIAGKLPLYSIYRYDGKTYRMIYQPTLGAFRVMAPACPECGIAPCEHPSICKAALGDENDNTQL